MNEPANDVKYENIQKYFVESKVLQLENDSIILKEADSAADLPASSTITKSHSEFAKNKNYSDLKEFNECLGKDYISYGVLTQKHNYTNCGNDPGCYSVCIEHKNTSSTHQFNIEKDVKDQSIGKIDNDTDLLKLNEYNLLSNSKILGELKTAGTENKIVKPAPSSTLAAVTLVSPLLANQSNNENSIIEINMGENSALLNKKKSDINVVTPERSPGPYVKHGYVSEKLDYVITKECERLNQNCRLPYTEMDKNEDSITENNYQNTEILQYNSRKEDENINFIIKHKNKAQNNYSSYENYNIQPRKDDMMCCESKRIEVMNVSTELCPMASSTQSLLKNDIANGKKNGNIFPRHSLEGVNWSPNVKHTQKLDKIYATCKGNDVAPRVCSVFNSSTEINEKLSIKSNYRNDKFSEKDSRNYLFVKDCKDRSSFNADINNTNKVLSCRSIEGNGNIPLKTITCEHSSINTNTYPQFNATNDKYNFNKKANKDVKIKNCSASLKSRAEAFNSIHLSSRKPANLQNTEKLMSRGNGTNRQIYESYENDCNQESKPIVNSHNIQNLCFFNNEAKEDEISMRKLSKEHISTPRMIPILSNSSTAPSSGFIQPIMDNVSIDNSTNNLLNSESSKCYSTSLPAKVGQCQLASNSLSQQSLNNPNLLGQQKLKITSELAYSPKPNDVEDYVSTTHRNKSSMVQSISKFLPAATSNKNCGTSKHNSLFDTISTNFVILPNNAEKIAFTEGKQSCFEANDSITFNVSKCIGRPSSNKDNSSGAVLETHSINKDQLKNRDGCPNSVEGSNIHEGRVTMSPIYCTTQQSIVASTIHHIYQCKTNDEISKFVLNAENDSFKSKNREPLTNQNYLWSFHTKPKEISHKTNCSYSKSETNYTCKNFNENEKKYNSNYRSTSNLISNSPLNKLEDNYSSNENEHNTATVHQVKKVSTNYEAFVNCQRTLQYQKEENNQLPAKQCSVKIQFDKYEQKNHQGIHDHNFAIVPNNFAESHLNDRVLLDRSNYKYSSKTSNISPKNEVSVRIKQDTYESIDADKNNLFGNYNEQKYLNGFHRENQQLPPNTQQESVNNLLGANRFEHKNSRQYSQFGNHAKDGNNKNSSQLVLTDEYLCNMGNSSDYRLENNAISSSYDENQVDSKLRCSPKYLTQCLPDNFQLKRKYKNSESYTLNPEFSRFILRSEENQPEPCAEELVNNSNCLSRLHMKPPDFTKLGLGLMDNQEGRDYMRNKYNANIYLNSTATVSKSKTHSENNCAVLENKPDEDKSPQYLDHRKVAIDSYLNLEKDNHSKQNKSNERQQSNNFYFNEGDLVRLPSDNKKTISSSTAIDLSLEGPVKTHAIHFTNNKNFISTKSSRQYAFETSFNDIYPQLSSDIVMCPVPIKDRNNINLFNQKPIVDDEIVVPKTIERNNYASMSINKSHEFQKQINYSNSLEIHRDKYKSEKVVHLFPNEENNVSPECALISLKSNSDEHLSVIKSTNNSKMSEVSVQENFENTTTLKATCETTNNSYNMRSPNNYSQSHDPQFEQSYMSRCIINKLPSSLLDNGRSYCIQPTNNIQQSSQNIINSTVYLPKAVFETAKSPVVMNTSLTSQIDQISQNMLIPADKTFYCGSQNSNNGMSLDSCKSALFVRRAPKSTLSQNACLQSYQLTNTPCDVRTISPYCEPNNDLMNKPEKSQILTTYKPSISSNNKDRPCDTLRNEHAYISTSDKTSKLSLSNVNTHTINRMSHLHSENAFKYLQKQNHKTKYRKIVNRMYGLCSEDDLNYQIIKRTLNKDISLRRSDINLNKSHFDSAFTAKLNDNYYSSNNGDVESAKYQLETVNSKKEEPRVNTPKCISTHKCGLNSTIPPVLDISKVELLSCDELEEKSLLSSNLLQNDVSVTMTKMSAGDKSIGTLGKHNNIIQSTMPFSRHIASVEDNIKDNEIIGTAIISKVKTDSSDPFPALRDYSFKEVATEPCPFLNSIVPQVQNWKTFGLFKSEKSESPLDLSIKTVKTNADTTAADESRCPPVDFKINFLPNFAKHGVAGVMTSSLESSKLTQKPAVNMIGKSIKSHVLNTYTNQLINPNSMTMPHVVSERKSQTRQTNDIKSADQHILHQHATKTNSFEYDNMAKTSNYYKNIQHSPDTILSSTYATKKYQNLITNSKLSGNTDAVLVNLHDEQVSHKTDIVESLCTNDKHVSCQHNEMSAIKSPSCTDIYSKSVTSNASDISRANVIENQSQISTVYDEQSKNNIENESIVKRSANITNIRELSLRKTGKSTIKVNHKIKEENESQKNDTSRIDLKKRKVDGQYFLSGSSSVGKINQAMNPENQQEMKNNEASELLYCASVNKHRSMKRSFDMFDTLEEHATDLPESSKKKMVIVSNMPDLKLEQFCCSSILPEQQQANQEFTRNCYKRSDSLKINVDSQDEFQIETYNKNTLLSEQNPNDNIKNKTLQYNEMTPLNVDHMLPDRCENYYPKVNIGKEYSMIRNNSRKNRIYFQTEHHFISRVALDNTAPEENKYTKFKNTDLGHSVPSSSCSDINLVSFDSSPNFLRGVDKKTISKLRSSIEIRELEKQKIRVDKKIKYNEECTNKQDIASIIAARIRTKGELKGYILEDNHLEKPQYDQNGSLSKKSYDEIYKKKSITSIVEISDDESKNSIDLMDWEKVCDSFVEQLQTTINKYSSRKRHQRYKSHTTDTNNILEKNKCCSGAEQNAKVDELLEDRPAISVDVLPTKTISKFEKNSSSDEDKPLFLLVQHRLTNISQIKNETSSEKNSRYANVNSTNINDESNLTSRILEKLSHNARVKHRLEQEKRLAELLSKTSSSECELKDESRYHRAKKLTRKRRSYDTNSTNTDSSGAEEESMMRNLIRSRAESCKRKCIEKLSSSVKLETFSNNVISSSCDNFSVVKLEEESTKSNRANSLSSKFGNSVKEHKSPSASLITTMQTKDWEVRNGGNNIIKTALNHRKKSNDVKQIKNWCRKAIMKTSSVRNSVLDWKTEEKMTRSKCKKEMEQRLANSKVLRNDKIVQNNSYGPKLKLSQKLTRILRSEIKSKTKPNTKYLYLTKNKNTTRSGMDYKRKKNNIRVDVLEITEKINEQMVNKFSQASVEDKSGHSNSNESLSECETQSVSNRLRPRQTQTTHVGTINQNSMKPIKNITRHMEEVNNPIKIKAEGTQKSIKKNVEKQKSKECIYKKSIQEIITSTKCNSKQNVANKSTFPPGWEREVYHFKRSLKIPTSLISIKGPLQHRVSTSLPDLDPHSSYESDISISETKNKNNQKINYKNATKEIKANNAATHKKLRTSKIKKKNRQAEKNGNIGKGNVSEQVHKFKNVVNVEEIKKSNTEETNDDKTRDMLKCCDDKYSENLKIEKKSRSIIDVLHQRVSIPGGFNSKSSKRNIRKIGYIPRILPCASNELELLPTPGAQEKDVFKSDQYFKQGEIFKTEVLLSRTRTEYRIMKNKELIREIFGVEERPASAPPELRNVCETDIQATAVSFDEKYQEYLRKMNEIDFDDRPRKHISKADVITAINEKLTTPTNSAIKSSAKEKRTWNIESENSGRNLDKNNYDLSNTNFGCLHQSIEIIDNMQGDNSCKTAFIASNHNFIHTNPLLFKRKKISKYRNSRRKGSSGFDYIRKKKKTSLQTNCGKDIKKRRKVVRGEILALRNENDVSREIQKWVLNKGVGQSVLHKAACQGYLDVVAYCLERINMPPNLKDNAGYTPLHEACSKGRLDIARLLLQYGANHSETALSGIRPLHEATENGYIEIVRLLLSYGADPLLTTYSGSTPMMLADNNELRQFFKCHLLDIQNIGAHKQPWQFEGPWKIFDFDISGYNVFDGASELENYNCEFNQSVQKNNIKKQNFSNMTNTAANVPLCSRQKRDLNLNIMTYRGPTKQLSFEKDSIVKTELITNSKKAIPVSAKCAVMLNSIGYIERINSVKQFNNIKNKEQSTTIYNYRKNNKRIGQCTVDINREFGSELFEFEETEIPLPPLYLLKDEGSEKWVLLSDLCHLLKVKSKDTLLKQICPTIPVASVNKELLRELKMSDFLEKATCLQLLCAGEKLNIRSSKVVLVKYNDSVRSLLGVKSFLMQF